MDNSLPPTPEYDILQKQKMNAELSSSVFEIPPHSGHAPDDKICWVCGGKTTYRLCKIACGNCGFTRDCSDP